MEDVLTQLTRQFLPQMTAAEKSRALRSLKALIDAELFDLAASEGAEDDPDRACPWCGSPHYVKRGRDGRGTYEKTWRQYKVTPYPFYEYWIKQAKWDSRARRAIYGVA